MNDYKFEQILKLLVGEFLRLPACRDFSFCDFLYGFDEFLKQNPQLFGLADSTVLALRKE